MTILRYIYIISAAFLLLFTPPATAQDLPQMETDPEVKCGSLPNGTRYYVMANPETKGMADFALVQKDGAMSESVLSDLPALGISPMKYFISNGVAPHNGRFLQPGTGAAVFRLAEVMTSAKPSLMDSTLLVLMGMVDASKEVCAPSRNAIVASQVLQQCTLQALALGSHIVAQRVVWDSKVGQ